MKKSNNLFLGKIAPSMATNFILPGFLLVSGIVNFAAAQGTVTFQNGVRFQTIDPTGGAHLVHDELGNGLLGTQYVAELYAGTAASSLTPITSSISRFRGLLTTARGKWAVSTISGGPNDPILLPGIGVGQTGILQVRAWDFSAYSTYEESLSKGDTHGASDPFSYTVPTPGAPPEAYYMEGFRAFAVRCTPHRALAVPQVVDGVVVAANITDKGCGYTDRPEVLILGDGGMGATGTAYMSDGRVAFIQITSGGCCYTNAPKILISSPPFIPTVQILVSRVRILQTLQLNQRYVLESSRDLTTWSATGPPFTAQSESAENEFDVDVTGQFFRLREVP